MKTLRISGVYNSDIVRQLIEQNIREVGFDLRPRSFNFIQIHAIQSILSELPSSRLKIFLQFENDKDFVIKEIVQKVCATTGLVAGENLWVEYSGSETPEFCNKVGIPYIKLLIEKDFSPWLNSSKCHGLVINEQFMGRLGMHADALSFLGQLFDRVTSDFRIDLTLDWSSEISKSLLEFYPFEALNFHIDSKVETTYRSVNLQLVRGHVEHTKRFLNLT